MWAGGSGDMEPGAWSGLGVKRWGRRRFGRRERVWGLADKGES